MHALPPEIIERILICCGPRDVSSYSRTCKYAHKLVYGAKDQFLWRELFLGRPFDDLRKAIITPKGPPEHTLLPSQDDSLQHGNPHWTPELQKRINAEIIAHSATRDAYLLEAAYEAFLSAIATAVPVEESAPASASGAKSDNDSNATKAGDSEDELVSRSENIRWLDRLLRKTRVLDILPAYTGAAIDFPSLGQLEAEADAEGPAIEPSPSSPSPRPSTSEQAPTSSISIQRCRVRRSPSSDLYEVCWIPPQFQRANQMRAQLRASVALSFDNSFDETSCRKLARLRKASRAYVYDMRRYQQSTLWGPYRVADDNHTLLVNWEHIEHILNVVGLKLREIPILAIGHYKKPLFQMDALRAYSAVGSFERPEGDWAGVTGIWRRFVCFMDYRDLYMFNYSLLPPGPHDPNFFDDPFDEALRPVELQLSLITKEQYYSEPNRIAMDPLTKASLRNMTADIDDPAFPTLYFKGHSRGGAHAADATIRGKVAIMSDGAIRSQFVTTYDGRMQWSAEAVQVGHVCSAAGIAGIWTGAHHDRDDPAGPFWMTRVTDELPAGVLNNLH